MRYLVARRREDARETGYRIYITDAAKIIAENTARLGGGSTLTQRWIDAAEVRKVPEDNRTAREIIADIAERAGITIS